MGEFFLSATIGDVSALLTFPRLKDLLLWRVGLPIALFSLSQLPLLLGADLGRDKKGLRCLAPGLAGNFFCTC